MHTPHAQVCGSTYQGSRVSIVFNCCGYLHHRRFGRLYIILNAYFVLRQCFREALRIVQLPANSGNYISGVLTARIWWRLSGILGPCEESQTMQAKALEYLEARIGHKVPFEDVGKTFEDLVFYWSRLVSIHAY